MEKMRIKIWELNDIKERLVEIGEEDLAKDLEEKIDELEKERLRIEGQIEHMVEEIVNLEHALKDKDR